MSAAKSFFNLRQPLCLLVLVFLVTGLIFLTIYNTVAKSEVQVGKMTALVSRVEQLINDSCTDCQKTELVWDIGRSGLSVAFDRKSGTCPTIVTGQSFYTLGVKRAILAEIGGKELSMPKSSVFQSCHVDWQIQLAN